MNFSSDKAIFSQTSYIHDKKNLTLYSDTFTKRRRINEIDDTIQCNAYNHCVRMCSQTKPPFASACVPNRDSETLFLYIHEALL